MLSTARREQLLELADRYEEGLFGKTYHPELKQAIANAKGHREAAAAAEPGRGGSASLGAEMHKRAIPANQAVVDLAHKHNAPQVKAEHEGHVKRATAMHKAFSELSARPGRGVPDRKGFGRG